MVEIADFLAYTALGMFTITFSVPLTVVLVMLLIKGFEYVSGILTGLRE